MFFGSAINNFGVREILEALVEWAPPPQPRDGTLRTVHPTEAAFSGFVFKIQANMDPKHRDRIAFFRVCSGRYVPGMKVRHLRAGREMKIGNALTFMANERVKSEDAVAGDIIGIHNHGQLQIGDTLTEGETLAYKGIPYFAPELFRVARPRDPFKAKQLAKGLKELGEEGAIQVFASAHTNTLLLGAVGQLQFEIVAHRLATEYKVDALYDPANVATARWLTFPDDNARRNFEREQAAALATRRRRQSGVPRDQQVQPAGDDGALAEGRLPRHPRARAAARARLRTQRCGRNNVYAISRHASADHNPRW